MQTESSSSMASGNENKQSTVDAKILADLDQLKEKLDLCHGMMNPTDGSPAPSLKNNDALLGVIGFLEACSPRMKELVEAAAQGAVSESVLMECLDVNDRVVKQLSDIETFAVTETPAMTTSAATPTTSLHSDLDDLLLDDDDDKAKPAVIGGKTTGEAQDDDPFGSDILAPTTNAPANTTDPFGNDVVTQDIEASATTTDTAKDDFDSFFEERTSSK